MKLEFYILGVLTMNPMTGYDIKKYLDTEGRFGRARAPLSQIYTTLKRMAANEWVTFEEEQREGKPDIKIYNNTEAGQNELLAYLNSPIEPAFRFRESNILFRMMFAFLIEPEILVEQLQTELDFRREQIAAFRPRDRTIQSTLLPADKLAFAQEIFDELHNYGARSVDDYVLLLEEMIMFYEKRAAKSDSAANSPTQ